MMGNGGPIGGESALDRTIVRSKLTDDLLDSVPVALSLRDPSGKYLFVNRTWEQWFGRPREQIVGSRVQDRFPAEIAERVLALDRAALDRGPGAHPETSDFEFAGRRYTQTRSVMADDHGAAVGLLVASIDVTEHHAQERRLLDQMVLTRAVIDENPNAMYLKDTLGRYVSVNDAWLKMVGVTRERAIGRNVREIFGDAESEKYHAEDMRLLAQGHGWSEVESLRTGPDGEPQWLLVRKAVLRRADGEVTGLIGTNTDITHLKRIETELADRNKFITEVIEALPVSVVIRDTQSRHVQVNRTWERYYNVERKDIIGKRFGEFPGWQDKPELVAFAKEAERLDRETLARGPDQFLEPVERRRGGRVYLNTRRALVDTSGRPVGIVGVSIDVTEQKVMAEILELEQRRLALVVRAAKVGIVDWDGYSHKNYYSPRFREMLGHSPSADTSRWPPYEELVHPHDREGFTRRYEAWVKTKDGDGRYAEFFGPDEHRLQRADGSYAWIEASGVGVRDEKGFVTRLIAAITDITERRAQEEFLRQSVALREEVERMSRHDLKTPIHSVIAVSRMLRENSRLAKEDTELLATVERAAYRILNMVNLSLDLFRMEQGTYELHPQAVDLDEVAARVATDLQGQAASKHVHVVVKRKASAVASAEELLCYSMLANLVKNAIEAAPEASSVSIELDREDGRAIARVHNVGAVPEHVRARFFQKYATAGKSAGLGLGAYSAHLLARVQGGTLTLDTSEEAGTTLTVRLQAASATQVEALRDAAPAEADTVVPSQLPPLRVLVADDDDFNRLVLRRYLPTPPLKVTVAVNGRAAIDAAQREWPDVALLDLEMPVMDGYEAARRLRDIERTQRRKRCLVVAISSNDEEAIIERALAAGCDHYLVKPAPRELLWKLLAGASVPLASGGAGPVEAQPDDEIVVDADLGSALAGFIASRREALDEMPRALESGDRETFRRLAHRLAGSFALYGFRWAAAQSKALERHAAEGDPNELAARTRQLRAHLDTAKIRVGRKDTVTP